jgi:ABC-2 type transport system permease protein
MIRLVRVELTRLRWRRAVLVLLVGCFAVPAVLFAGMAWGTRPVSEADLRQAQAQIDQEMQYVQKDIDRCATHPDQYGVPAGTDEAATRAQCEEMMLPRPEWYVGRQPLDVAQERTNTGAGVATLLIGLVMLIGTTFAGHDWNTGSMSNQLLFDPRRLRVWGAKALVVFGVGLVVSALALAGFWAATAWLAQSRDLTVPDGTWDAIRGSWWRTSLLAAAAGAGAYALTMLFRSTVATLGIMFGVSVAGTIITAAILRGGSERWMLPTNVSAWMFGGWTYYDESKCNPMSESSDNCQAFLSQTDGGLFLLTLLVVAVALSIWSFRRRDVP